MSVVYTSPAIKYSEPAQSNHGTYNFTRVLPQGSSSVSLSTSSQQELLIDLPNRCMNLARSTLDFDLDIPASAGVNYIHTLGQNAIERIRLYTRSGVNLVDITDCGFYTRCVTPYVTKLSEAKTNARTQSAATEAAGDIVGKGFNTCTSRALKSALTADGDSAKRVVGPAGVFAVANADVDYEELQYITSSTSATASWLSCSIPLKEFHHSLMSVDKDLYFGQSLVLSISFAATAKMGALSDDSVKNLGAVVVKNVRLNLAIEANAAIAAAITQKVMTSGMEQMMPYVYARQVQGGNSSTSYAQQERYNSGHGHALLNIYSVTAAASTTGLLCNDISNTGGTGKITSFQASMDNNLLSEYRPDCTKSEDYILQRHLLEDSCVLNANVFRHNRVNIESFRSGRCVDWKETDTVLDGLSLDTERTFNVDKTIVSLAAGYRHWIWAVVQRRLVIAPNGDIAVF